MHDSQIEEQLRGVLRAEGDGIPLTITAAELERRLAARRSATGGRRLRMVAAAVAAVVVVSMVAAGNGWLKLPAIGTVPSPSASATPQASPVPSFVPVPGVARIEPAEGSTVLTEVLPSNFAGRSDGAFDTDLPLDQYVVTVDVLCVGTSLTLSEGSRQWPVYCNSEPTIEGTETGFVIPVVDGHLALRWTVDAGVGYTILVTTSVLPTSLPALESLDGTPVIDEASGSDRPISEGTGTLVTRSLGSVPDATEYSISIVCLGPGQLAYSIGQPGRSDHAMSSSTVCDGKTLPEAFSHEAEAGIQHEVFITADSRTAWHVMIGVAIPGPAPSATSEPPAARPPLGRPDEAILVRAIGPSWTTPDSLEVTRFDPADSSSEVIATIPGSVVPAGKWISTYSTPVVSATGWLAIPIRPGSDPADTESAIVIVDLLHPTAQPWTIVGISSGSWNVDETLAAVGADGTIQLFDPATRYLGEAPIQDSAVQIATVKNGATDPIWTTAPNSRFLARRATGATLNGPPEWGAISVDGSFGATTDLPPVYQRTGLERLAGADAHSFVPACTGSGNDPLEAGCTMVEIDAKGMPISTRVGRADYVSLADFAWAANGRDAWLLLDDGTERESGASGDGIAWLYLSEPNGTRTERARLQLGGGDFAILGVGESLGGRPIVAIGSRNSWLRALVTTSGSEFAAPAPGSSTVLEGTAWFAGWAGLQLDYDPD